ncbi:MAG: RhuM family protein [Caulobacteraceae bacterium]
MSDGELILYRSDDGLAQVQLRAADGTVWLAQAEIAALFQTTPQNITQHIRSIYAEGEAGEAATCKEDLQVRREGAREVARALRLYSLEVILAVGYRVRSVRVRKADVTTAKNYLDADELRALNAIVATFLDVADERARRRAAMTMADWEAEVDSYLRFMDRPVLAGPGRVSHERMERIAHERYQTFDAGRRAAESVRAEVEHEGELQRIEGETARLARGKPNPSSPKGARGEP